MSAYIVETETVRYILACLNSDSAELLTKTAGVPFDPATEPPTAAFQRLGSAMMALNELSVRRRYQSDDTADAYIHRIDIPDRLRAYKALRCWLYQSCECGCDELPLWKAMKHLSNEWAHGIVEKMPEYDRASGW